MKNDNSSSGEGILISKDGDGTDVVSVWFQMEVLQESRMMIPDCHRRLAIAHADLVQLLVSNTESPLSGSAKNIISLQYQTVSIKLQPTYFVVTTITNLCPYIFIIIAI